MEAPSTIAGNWTVIQMSILLVGTDRRSNTQGQTRSKLGATTTSLQCLSLGQSLRRGPASTRAWLIWLLPSKVVPARSMIGPAQVATFLAKRTVIVLQSPAPLRLKSARSLRFKFIGGISLVSRWNLIQMRFACPWLSKLNWFSGRNLTHFHSLISELKKKRLTEVSLTRWKPSSTSNNLTITSTWQTARLNTLLLR